uniref:AtzH-like domain-containing protein n=1 Tax=Xanthomonas sacchari TaxID=56458 RepID=UPI0012DFFC5F
MILNAPEVLAEVQAAFAAYERALMDDDVAALDRLFHDAPTTVRYGVGEALYGADAIRAFRRGRGGSPQRRAA